ITPSTAPRSSGLGGKGQAERLFGVRPADERAFFLLLDQRAVFDADLSDAVEEQIRPGPVCALGQQQDVVTAPGGCVFGSSFAIGRLDDGRRTLAIAERE